jgi:hypothetical protein
MAELADAADSKSAGTWYHGGSTPPPGTSLLVLRCLYQRPSWRELLLLQFLARNGGGVLPRFSSLACRQALGDGGPYGPFPLKTSRSLACCKFVSARWVQVEVSDISSPIIPGCCLSTPRQELEAFVDTGAVMTLLPQDVVDQLGLPLDGRIVVTLANEERIKLPRARLLSLTLADRQWTLIASSHRPAANRCWVNWSSNVST